MNKLRSYYRIMLGQKSSFAKQSYEGEFIGTHYGFDFDLSNSLPEDWRDFNKEFRSVFIEKHPNKTKVAAGLACGAVHTICKGIKQGDIVLCPNGSGQYWVGEVVSEYYYAEGQEYPHRRKVAWLPVTIERSDMSLELQRSTSSTGTTCNITKYVDELEAFISGKSAPTLISTDELVEDPAVFALEKHLEDFLVKNWEQTELGRSYNIFEDEGEVIGQQYPSDTGPIDILAISKDKKEYLVVELKKGRASDAVVGQIQRYMGFVLEELTEPGQVVKGVIIALEDDLRLRRALSVTSNIGFYRYQIDFKLIKN